MASRADVKTDALSVPGEASSASADLADSAEAANLRYGSDAAAGIRRRRTGRGFAYRDPEGKTIRDPATLRRIKSLAVPPAWKDVWISPDANCHLQATGRDGRGRKQYRYHPRWREVRDETKYDRMTAFGEALPRMRRRVERDLVQRGLPRQKVLAVVVRLLETTLARVGNEEYARSNGSFGLTTLRDHHATVAGSTVQFTFRGKGGKIYQAGVEDQRLARVVKQCQDIPGHELFQYMENGRPQSIDSADVNDYLREISGQDFTAKEFRTWAGTVHAFRALQGAGRYHSETQAKRKIVRAIETVAERLGNTPAICRKCYIHPGVLEAYLDGTLPPAPTRERGRDGKGSRGGLKPEEVTVLALIRDRMTTAA